MSTKKYLPLLLLFVFVVAIVFLFRSNLQSAGFDLSLLYIANFILFVLSFLGFLLQLKGLRSANHNAFIRGVYGSLLLKMFVVLIAVFAYVFLTHGKINKPSLFTSMGLYLVYTFVEVAQLMKLARKKTNA
ncbi:MAG: hypothetical protein ABIN25_00280 [Ginsengibacter sp.]